MDYLKDRSVAPITEAAAEWFVTLRTGDTTPEQRRHFAAWLADSPMHVREFLGIAETWGALKAGKSWPDASTEELMAVARAAPPVVALPAGAADRTNTGISEQHARTENSRTRRLHRRRTIWAVAASLLAVAAASLFGPGAQKYSTARGEQRSIVLADGSVVQLNTLSRMIVRLNGQARRIELPEGEAFFRVAHDPSRPFLVTTPTATVRALGTEFNVYSRSRDTEVAVLEGRVDVTTGASSDSKSTPAARIVLGARESIVLDRRGLASRAAARRPEEAASWTQRRLFFDDEPVARVIEEFNRYNVRQLRVSDPRLATLRISGVFDTGDPEALLKYLDRVHGIAVSGDSAAPLLEPHSDPSVR